ncbi:uncharacterized protein OCT59_004573 [Rhizophagus irregularis]|uniref:uncharacterized protein n=1 Tax=Rhizophagus irregularis TaxID=588596 RepID=UPI00332D1581|nr:hypothetical protein OCT59_004573 [Rhizophagus irregularis]
MDEIILSDDILEKIKNFRYYRLTKEQESLLDELIADKELIKCYKKHGSCNICNQPRTGNIYCRLSKGGFGTTYKAIWKEGYFTSWDFLNNNQLKRNGETKVALKCLHNSQDITADFLKEVESNILVCGSWIVRCFGITKDPKTNNFMMVMELKDDIHNCGLIHHDLHCGNILSDFNVEFAYITDLGLCQPANVESTQSNNKKIYGALLYLAPEILRGKEYTQSSDIYGFGIIAYEFCTGFPPYHNVAHDEFLALRICHGLRPKSNYKIPQLIFDIINQCWDADLSNRPKANDLEKFFTDLWTNNCNKDSIISKQIKEADEINKTSYLTLSSIGLSYITHSQAVYTSRLLDYKDLPEPRNSDNNDDSLGIEYSESLKMNFIKPDINSKDENN